MLNWNKKILKVDINKFNLSKYVIVLTAYLEGILTDVSIYEFII